VRSGACYSAARERARQVGHETITAFFSWAEGEYERLQGVTPARSSRPSRTRVLGCCQLSDVNPVEYLADVLPRLAQRVRLRDVPALLSARWKAARAPGAAAANVAGA